MYLFIVIYFLVYFIVKSDCIVLKRCYKIVMF